ncbi:hypothetical protein PMAYCL1PPCAC_26927, partial [Pristionchus mayeri]
QLLVLSSEFVLLLRSHASLLLVLLDGVESLLSSRMRHVHSKDQRRLVRILQLFDILMGEGRQAELDGSGLREDLQKQILGGSVGDTVACELLVRLPHGALRRGSVDDIAVVLDGRVAACLAAREDPDVQRDVLDVTLLLEVGTLMTDALEVVGQEIRVAFPSASLTPGHFSSECADDVVHVESVSSQGCLEQVGVLRISLSLVALEVDHGEHDHGVVLLDRMDGLLLSIGRSLRDLPLARLRVHRHLRSRASHFDVGQRQHGTVLDGDHLAVDGDAPFSHHSRLSEVLSSS